MPSRTSIESFLALDHIAFVALSRDSSAFANSVYRHLRDGDRTIYAVNASGDDLEGTSCYPRLADVPDPVEGVFVIVAPEQMAGVVREAIARRVPRIWLHRGAGQKPVPEDAVQLAQRAGIEVIDGACPLMFDAPVRGIHRAHRVLIRHRFAA